MSNQPSTDDVPPMLPKAERRAAGKLAARKRAAAKRRKKALQNTSVALAGIAVVVVLVIIFGGFGSGDPDPAAGSDATPDTSATVPDPAGAPTGPPTDPPATAVPDDVDPALRTKPAMPTDTADVTQLTVTPIVTGTGPAVVSGQTISVNYVGVTVSTGEEFDSSWTNGRPLSFVIAEGQVIDGWAKGLIGATVGSRVRLDIPAEQAYGEQAPQGYPAGDLRFIVDILSAS